MSGMAWSSLQPQTVRLRHLTRARLRQSLTPTCVRPDLFRAADTARRSNEATFPHQPRRYSPAVPAIAHSGRRSKSP